MRKILISLAAAGTALTFAAPASAQYFPQPQPAYSYGYGQTAYGQNYGQVRSLQYRIDGVQRQIRQLSERGMLRRNDATRLNWEARNLENQVRQSARYGLNPNVARNLDYGIARLERKVAQEARNGRGYGYNNGYYGNGYNNAYNGYGYNNGAYADSDGDGHDDNAEHDRWHSQHDNNDD